MSMKDLHNWIKQTLALVPALLNAAAISCTGIFRQGFNSLEFLVVFGAAGDTLSGTDKYEAIIEESDDDMTYTAVARDIDVLLTDAAGASVPLGAGGLWLTVDANAEAGKAYRIGYRGNKAYARVTVTGSGTLTNGTIVGVVAVQANPNLFPVSGVGA